MLKETAKAVGVDSDSATDHTIEGTPTGQDSVQPWGPHRWLSRQSADPVITVIGITFFVKNCVKKVL